MSSTTAWPLSEIEASSADLVEPVRRRLAWWVERPAEHARFLNTLALMEHIGSRKIMVSQTRGPLGQEILKHLAEETRHAYFFKRAAETLARRPLEFDEHGRASARPRRGCTSAASTPRSTTTLGADAHVEVPYLYVSLTIELRAIWTYRLYQRGAGGAAGAALSLKSVLAEEELHLEQMLAGCGNSAPIPRPACPASPASKTGCSAASGPPSTAPARFCRRRRRLARIVARLTLAVARRHYVPEDVLGAAGMRDGDDVSHMQRSPPT